MIFALLTWMLAESYYLTEFKDWPPPLYWFVGAMTAIMLFVSVLFHELGHSVVALLCLSSSAGFSTARPLPKCSKSWFRVS